MNSNVKNSIIRMEEDELRKLVSQVKETIAENVDFNSAQRKFGAADLWNIQREKRNVQIRKHLA
ncbi:MAG: hypothetical protein ACR2FN_00305 [Chitinophagaceae bacterium]